MRFSPRFPACFNTQPPEGGWADGAIPRVGVTVSTHSRLKAAGFDQFSSRNGKFVSTHSRLKAAGTVLHGFFPCRDCFNTQPPEGGWWRAWKRRSGFCRFNTQPPEGGWIAFYIRSWSNISFNTQPPEGGW